MEKCTYWDHPFGQNSFDTRFANDAIVQRAKQIELIGASYTLDFDWVSAVPALYDQRAGVTYPAKRGTYRCDTYVMDSFYYSHAIVGGGKSYGLWGYNHPVWRETIGETSDWANKMWNMQFQSRTPRGL